MSQKHVIKIAVELRSAKLLVRFPCKLTFQLKTDSAHAETRTAYELRKGECVINETIEAEAEVLYDPLNGQYEDKKVRLVIQMSSTNGVIPAGSVSFNPCNKEYLERVEYTLPLEKCPDRSAQITFFQSYQLLRKNSPEAVYQSQFAERTSSRVGKMDLKYTTSNVHVPSQLQKQSSRDISSNSRNARLTPTNRNLSPKNRVKTTISQNQGYGGYRQQQQTEQQEQQYNQFGESQVLQEEQAAYQKYSSKYVEPNEKAQYIKEIARLKGELKSLQSEDRWDQLIRVKEENDALTSELEKIRERVRGLERREREVNLQLKEAKEESQRNKAKYLQSETLKNQSEIVLTDKERSVKEALGEVKRLEEKLQDLNVQLSNQQKRVQFKENSYQEQLRKMNEKYSQSENERQKLTFDYNSLLAKLQEAEKKHQATAKEKDRAFTEEKNRLNKKSDLLTQSLDKLKEEFAEKESLLTQTTNLLKQLQKKEVEREERVSSLESELELNKILLKKEQDQRKTHEREIEQYKVIEEERNNLRKKTNELTSQLAKLAEKGERQLSDLNSNDLKIKELESTLAEKNKEKDSLNVKFNSLKKELENLKREDEKRQREQETLSVQNFNAGQKINELKSKLETEKRDTEEMKSYYEQQLAYLAKSKEYSENEIEQLKWSVEKGREQYEEINNRLKQSNQQILQLNEDILISNEKAKRAEDDNKELRSVNASQRKEITELQQKERVLNDQVKAKSDNIYELQKKIQNFESELFILREKLKQTENAYDERKTSDEKNLKDREKVLGQKGEEITELQLEVMTLKEQLGSANQQLAIKTNEINYLKDTLQGLKQDITNRDLKLEEVREQLKQQLQLAETLTKENETLTKVYEEEKKNALKGKKDWEDYRRDTTKALERLIQEVGKDEENLAKHSLLSFPDSTISVMQVEAIKKRNLVLSKYQAKVVELQEELSVLESEVKKAKKIGQEKEQELEKALKAEREKYKQALLDSSAEKEESEAIINSLEEKRLQLAGEVEKLNNEIKKREEVIEETTVELNLANEEKENLKNELKTSQEIILSLKSSEIKWRVNNESKISQISGQNESVIERYKVNVAELQKKIASQEKISKEKDENIKRLQAKVNELTYEKERSEARVQDLNEKLAFSTEEKKELEKKIKTLEKEQKESTLQLQTLKETLTNEKIKFEEIQSKLNETYNTLSESQVSNEKLRSELESKTETVAELQGELKDKVEKIKVQGEKSSQEIKQLKEKIIGLNSTIELRDFQITQHQAQIGSLKESLTETKDELTRKKQESIKLGDKVQQYKNQELYTSQNIEILKSEKEFLEEENDRLKERVACLEEELGECQIEAETSEIKEREISKLKEELETVRLEKDRATSELRNSVSNTRMSGITASRIGGLGGNTEDKRRLRELQQLLQSKHIDLSIERKKLFNDFDREKRALVMQNAQLRQEIANLQSEFDFQRAQLAKEIESLSDECETLKARILEKNDLLLAQEKLLEAVNVEGNGEQIQEYILNIKSIFQRMEISKTHEEEMPVQHGQQGQEEVQ